jgi:hypothetical protein
LRKEKREKERGADGWSRDIPSKLKSASKEGVRVTNDMWKTFLFGHPVLHSLKPPCLARTWGEYVFRDRRLAVSMMVARG